MRQRFCDLERKLEALRFRGAGDVEVLEACGHAVIERLLLLKRTLAGLGDDGHRELLLTHLPDGALDMDDGWRT